MLGRSTADGGSTSAAGPSSESDEAHSLYKYIDISRVYGSNIGPARVADRQEAARRCIKPWHQRSDVAESTESLEGSTVILNIPFTQIVRISTLLINQGSGDEAPRRVRMYINRPHGLDLDEISDDVAPPPLAQSARNPHMPTTGAPTSGLPQADFLLRDQETTVGSPEERIQEYPLARFAARFANVQSVHVVLVSVVDRAIGQARVICRLELVSGSHADSRLVSKFSHTSSQTL